MTMAHVGAVFRGSGATRTSEVPKIQAHILVIIGHSDIYSQYSCCSEGPGTFEPPGRA